MPALSYSSSSSTFDTSNNRWITVDNHIIRVSSNNHEMAVGLQELNSSSRLSSSLHVLLALWISFVCIHFF